MSNWQSDEPLVSVLCATYQHRPFIEEALKGFLSQSTTFPFEVVVRDDASTDGTVEVLERISSRYSRIVRLITEPVNQWPEVRPFSVLFEAARGDYVALCEGDDYWFDPKKLQSQVDYLASHPEVSLVETDRLDIEDGRVTGISRGGTRTYVFRRAAIDSLARQALDGAPHFDIALRLFLSTRGRLTSLPVATAVWRYHDGGNFGPRGRLDPRPIQMDDLKSIFTTGAALQDRGAKAAGVLATREMVVRVCGSFGISPASMLSKVFIPVMLEVVRQRFLARARQRRLRRLGAG